MDREEQESYLLHFNVLNTRMCAPLSSITKVLPLVLLKKIPHSPYYLIGLMNLAGESIPIIDLGIKLGMTRNQAYALDMPILLFSNNEKKIGIIVDKIVGLEPFDKSKLQLLDDFHDKNSAFDASIESKNELSLLINVNKIIDIKLSQNIGINI